MTIRDNAIHCEARKWSYRQTKDGVVVSFLLHPNDMPDGLAIAELGTRYMMALVEIGDDEQPKPAKQRRAFKELKASQQAGMLCNDSEFRRFLNANIKTTINADDAAEAVRIFCHVDSRSKLDGDAGDKWAALVNQFNTWKQDRPF